MTGIELIAKEREDRMNSLVKQIQDKINKLKKLNYSVSDCASTISIFDNEDTTAGLEGKIVNTLH